MNGRIYDPTLGKFLQADPFVQAPNNSQSYNRYSYVMNNPMSATDPSGFISIFKNVRKFLKKNWRVIAAAAVTYFTAGAASGWAAGWGFTGATAGAVSGAIAGAAGGFVATGTLRGTLTGAFTGAAFGAIGGYFKGTSLEGGLAHIGSHGLAGGVISDLQGGKFGHGFFSAGLTKGLNINASFDKFGAGWDIVRITTAAIVGGTISKITGGKFGNGAVTAGMAQALNGNSQIEDPDIGGYSPASGNYATENGGRVEFLQANGTSSLLTDQAGNWYEIDPTSGIASIRFEAGNGAAVSVSPESYLMGGLGLGRAIVATGYKAIAYVTGRGTPTYANFARGANARNMWKTMTFGRAFRSYQQPASFYWNKAGGNFGNAVNSLGRSNAMYNRALIPLGPVGGAGIAINNYE
ncbi:RHS repeat-associated core domain-containing protein [Glaciecola sp. SC05]|uniref:RHS repeat-associated core domain-containing protein n=1 Tax=Glaciecola sp. SC05 TaxID=1987355 RepID=UPI0035296192